MRWGLFFAFWILAPCAFANTTQVVFGGVSSSPSATAVNYSAIAGRGSGAWDATEANMHSPSPATTLSNLRVVLDSAPGAGTSLAFAVMVNNAASKLNCTVSGTATTCQALVSATVTSGQTLSLRSTPTGTPTVGPVQWSLLSVHTQRSSSLYWSLSNTLGIANVFVSPSGTSRSATESSTESIVSDPGAMTDLYVECSVAPGAGKSIVLTFRVNEAATSSTCTISGNAATTCNNTTKVVTLASGDRIAINEDNSTGGASNKCRYGWRFQAATEGRFLALTSSSGATVSPTVINYIGAHGGQNGPSATESSGVQNGVQQPCVANWMYLQAATAPGGSTSYQVVFRVNGADGHGNLGRCTITGTATTCNANMGQIRLANDDLIDFEVIPSGTPLASAFFGGFVCANRLRRLRMID